VCDVFEPNVTVIWCREFSIFWKNLPWFLHFLIVIVDLGLVVRLTPTDWLIDIGYSLQLLTTTGSVFIMGGRQSPMITVGHMKTIISSERSGFVRKNTSIIASELRQPTASTYASLTDDYAQLPYFITLLSLLHVCMIARRLVTSSFRKRSQANRDETVTVKKLSYSRDIARVCGHYVLFKVTHRFSYQTKARTPPLLSE